MADLQSWIDLNSAFVWAAVNGIRIQFSLSQHKSQLTISSSCEQFGDTVELSIVEQKRHDGYIAEIPSICLPHLLPYEWFGVFEHKETSR